MSPPDTERLSERGERLERLTARAHALAEASRDVAVRCWEMPSACATALAVLAGCSPVCDVITFSAPVITVTDASTGHRLCDVTVTARCAALDAGDAPVGGGASGCDYGTSLMAICNVTTVTISRRGYQTATVPRVEARASADCGPAPAPERVNVALTPVAGASQ